MFKRIIAITFILFFITKIDIAFSSCNLQSFPEDAYDISGVCLVGTYATYDVYREVMDPVECPAGNDRYIQGTEYEIQVDFGSTSVDCSGSVACVCC